MKKTIAPYLFSVILLGAFSGLLMGGQDTIKDVGFMCLFWALMLVGML